MIAAYLRESTVMQDIETQRRLIQEYCARRGVQYQEFPDDAESGMIPFARRPESRKLLEAAKQGKVREVIVYRLDRLGRDHADTYATIGELLKRGVKIISLKQGEVDNTPSGRFVSGIHSLVGAYERETFLERSIDAIRELVKQGIWTGGVTPYGFRKTGGGKQARLMPATATPISGYALSEASVIKRIYRDAADGKSCVRIAEALNRLGVPTAYARDGRTVLRQKTAGIWTSTRVRNLIVNPIYKGVFVWGKRKFVREDLNNPKIRHLKMNPRDQWIEVPRPELAIVSPELWKQAQDAVHRNQIAAMAHPQHDYLLRGLVKCTCGLCYYGLTSARQSSAREVVYYMHSRRSPRPRCTTAAVRGNDLEAAVWSDIECFLAKPGQVIRQLEEKMESKDGESRKISDEIRELESARERKFEARKRLLTLFTEGAVQRDEYNQERARIEEAIASIEKRLVELQKVFAEQDANTFALKSARTVLEDLRDKASGKLTFAKRRAIVEALVVGITVTPVPPGKLPDAQVQYRFEPNLQRYLNQFEPDLPLNDMHI
jgi:site-specific DNA recombinase